MVDVKRVYAFGAGLAFGGSLGIFLASAGFLVSLLTAGVSLAFGVALGATLGSGAVNCFCSGLPKTAVLG